MHSHIRPHTHVALRLPSGILKIVELKPNTNIFLGKFGTFNSNLLLGRPYYNTYELLDKDDGKKNAELRVVPAAELHAEAVGDAHAPQPVGEEADENAEGGAGFDIVGADGEVIMRNNRLTVDDATRQTLTMEEIEELKKAGTGSGKEIIAKIMASHQAISEKTAFSLAKYTLRKSRKFLRRFTALPLDVGRLAEHILEKEAYRIMELREESLGLISSWSNIHCGATSRLLKAEDGISQIGGGRWLVVDDTGGLVVAALAEKMGLLYPTEESDDTSDDDEKPTETPSNEQQPSTDTVMTDADQSADPSNPTDPSNRPRKAPRPHIPQMSAYTNTLTILHPNSQPNLACLKFFGYDVGQPAPTHPLYRHLKSLSWLSLIAPEDDPSYIEPEQLSATELESMKSSKRGNYYKKRRRWEKTKRVVDETKRGGFDGLVVATSMDVKGVLRELVPLVRGGGKVVVYHQNVEPLVELVDCYSKERRAAFIAKEFGEQGHNGKRALEVENGVAEDEEDFPVNPTLLLAPSLQTARARQWQVLPERTHPMMTSKGGAEGYLFTATRVIPVEGRVEARGHGTRKKRKTVAES
ncbi:eukaryotic translation initiation factor 3, gamma subunit [Didymella exigua CBS 183.55]|uniref:tRNA (adenine(58)-N(1))-methyltransferase non-catalytic subunit TRM6 n=1 Tax=Didymella exigua CBS 183.55 TaxID=1150837 RepID=A0A6A5S579_9PLEO|nr:eukaryotic translation initiation factor 3, gamma subunit [Didymella exigua CBS 183.55]KAF1933646.1 eukaryotic translation initiation factor 3, gamma subunit [Didymella exigua CBS 183.55]